MNAPQREVDVLIVGGGAAGLAAALTLGRSRRSVLVVDEGKPRNAPASGVHGYLGLESIAPTELLDRGRQEVAGYGVTVITDRVESAEKGPAGFTVRTADGTAFRARRLLVASGLTDVLPDVTGLAQRWGRDVLHCPYCHGWEVRDRRIVVLGTGPLSMHQAQLFRQLSAEVILLRHEAPEPDAAESERLRARGIRVLDKRAAALETSDDTLVGVRTEVGELVDCDAVAVGSRTVPNGTVLSSLGIESITSPAGVGEVIPADERGQTSVPGVYVAGNVDDPTAQVSTAAARGARVGAMINMDLIEEEIATAVSQLRADERNNR